ncbi:MAG: glycoside hydrolase family 2 protein, partial [Firmicutes bacterium]|nr:glycoside hydrolase family 2 protein [Bacillota bacterium]
LPHTVKETPFDYFDESVYQMVSGYRRRFVAPEEWEGKHVSLTFEGAAHEATVYVNGEEALTHSCGYTSFTIDLTERLRYGAENTVAVRLDSRESLNVPPFGFVIDYMTYGGLYREAYLEVTEKARIADVFLRTEGTVDAPKLAASVETENPDGRNVFLRLLLLDGPASCGTAAPGGSPDAPERPENASMTDGKRLLEVFYPEALKTAGNAKYEAVTDLADIRLWTPDDPALYTVRTELVDAASLEVVDAVDVRFGFRFAEFRTDGFYLNEEKVKIVGLNRHQSYPYVGYAMPAAAQALDAKILKEELGLNAVRTSHYPQSHAFVGACDRLGLLVFTEIPGWQNIGDAAWQAQAVRNVEEMVREYRNHPSIILWGVRINESQDNDELYKKTNETARCLDPSRQTGGVRYLKKSHLLEDVYTYNDFVHSGKNEGCEPKKNVTPDVSKPYLITEYGGHMFPTKPYDDEEHRRDHLLRHAKVLNDVAGEADISGSFGWCMFDYNTHRDFGSGDRICYHGVLDMFRNAKPAASVYAVRGEEPVLEVTSSMDIGEHPASNRGVVWIVSNADSVRMYKNDRLLKEYFPKDSPYANLPHGPIAIDDFLGDALAEGEGFKPAKAAAVKEILNHVALYGMNDLPPAIKAKAAKCIALYGMRPNDAVKLYNKYVGDWGGAATVYRFDAVKDGKVVKTVVKSPSSKVFLAIAADHTGLEERATYDVATVRIRAVDENGNTLPFFNEPVTFETEGPVESIGPAVISLKGGMGGTYVRTVEGKTGPAKLTVRSAQTESVTISFTMTDKRGDRV